jgi:hypothetical protein
MINLSPFRAYPVYFSPDIIHSGIYSGFYRYSRYFLNLQSPPPGMSLLKVEGNTIAEYKSWRLISTMLEICPIGFLEERINSIKTQTGQMLDDSIGCLIGLCRQDIVTVGDDPELCRGLCVLFLEKIEMNFLKKLFSQKIPRDRFLPLAVNTVKIGELPVNGYLRGSIKSHENEELWWTKLARDNELARIDDRSLKLIDEVKKYYTVTEL